jgi:peptidoglycan/LPS O-acetylase OafA/YrhL
VSAERIPTLDGWRGIAILLVLIGHFSPSLAPHEPAWIEKIGQHGVAIFFVLSGFLITTRLLHEDRIDLRGFYLRRLFRLMPCAWLYLGSLSLLSALSGAKLATAPEIFSCIFSFRNYFDAQHLPTAHFWSLSIEQQFSLVWPALLLLTGIRRARWLALATAVLLASWRLLHWTQISSQPFAASTATQYRADALLIGCALALALPGIVRYLRAWMAGPLLIGIALCICRYPDMIPLHESILIALLLAVTSQIPMPGAALLNWRPLAFLGAVSYSVYIWQQPFFLLAGHTVHGLITALAALALVSLASYYLVEQPLIRLGRRIEARLQAKGPHSMTLDHHNGLIVPQACRTVGEY